MYSTTVFLLSADDPIELRARPINHGCELTFRDKATMGGRATVAMSDVHALALCRQLEAYLASVNVAVLRAEGER